MDPNYKAFLIFATFMLGAGISGELIQKWMEKDAAHSAMQNGYVQTVQDGKVIWVKEKQDAIQSDIHADVD